MADASSNILIIKNKRIVRPAIHQLTFSKSNPEILGLDIDSWLWMKLSAVGVCIASYLENRFMRRDYREIVFENYGLLNNHVDGKPLVTWVLEPGENSALEYELNGQPPKSCAYEIYIPAKWGDAVVDLASKGVSWVSSKEISGSYKLFAEIGGKSVPLTKKRGRWSISNSP